MHLRDYLEWPLRGTPIEPLQTDLAAHGRRLLATEGLRADADAMSPAESARLEALLDTEVPARAGAPRAEGEFPLVVYQPGMQGTVEEDFVLFEYLASHGYVVASGAFLDEDAMSLGSRASPREWQLDIGFLIGFLHAQPGVDRRRLALVGFSGGAQNALAYAAEGPAVDAVVSLDTTWDYPQNRAFLAQSESYLHFQKKAPGMSMPILAFASKGATFAPFDAAKHARRLYVTLDDLDHDDFMARGAVGATFAARKPGEAPAARVRAQYDAVCEYVRRFLDATLAGSAEAEGFLARTPAENGFAGAGVTASQREAEPRPPTERELADLAVGAGAVTALERCTKQRRSGGDPCPAEWPEAVGDYLLRKGRADLVVELLEVDVRQRPEAVPAAVLLGHAYVARGDHAGARRAYSEAVRRASAKDGAGREGAHEHGDYAALVRVIWRERAQLALEKLGTAR